MSRITPTDGARMPDRPAHAPAPGDVIPSHYRWCFGCGVDHPTGLHLRITAREGLRVSGDFTVTEHHQGAPGLAHGGVLTTAFDEVIGGLNWLLGDPVVTARIQTDFRRPVPVGSVLHIEAEVLGVDGRKVFASAVGRLNDAEGAIAVTSSALFIKVAIQHFLDHGNPEQIAEAIEDRAHGGPSWRTGDQELEMNP